MMHISVSTAPIRVKQKPLYSKFNTESGKYYYNSLCKSLENSPESLPMNVVFGLGTRLRVRMRTKLENGVLHNEQQPQSVVNGFY